MDILDQRLEIKGAPQKLLGLLALGAVMVAASLAVAVGAVRASSFQQMIGWVGVVFFGGVMVLLAGRLIGAKRPLIVLDRDGLWDRRVTRQPVPWSEIHSIRTWPKKGQNAIIVSVPPEVEEAVGLTRMARMTRGPNVAVKADGLVITATGLGIDHDALLHAIVSRRQAVHEDALRALDAQQM